MPAWTCASSYATACSVWGAGVGRKGPGCVKRLHLCGLGREGCVCVCLREMRVGAFVCIQVCSLGRRADM